VVRGLGIELDRHAVPFGSPDSDAEGTLNASWVLMTNNTNFLSSPEVEPKEGAWSYRRRTLLWTDDYASLFQVLNW
jgi:hypothetical protein